MEETRWKGFSLAKGRAFLVEGATREQRQKWENKYYIMEEALHDWNLCCVCACMYRRRGGWAAYNSQQPLWALPVVDWELGSLLLCDLAQVPSFSGPPFSHLSSKGLGERVSEAW